MLHEDDDEAVLSAADMQGHAPTFRFSVDPPAYLLSAQYGANSLSTVPLLSIPSSIQASIAAKAKTKLHYKAPMDRSAQLNIRSETCEISLKKPLTFRSTGLVTGRLHSD